MKHADYHTGDLVVYSMPKRSANPGPRAQSVFPSQNGDTYSYFVDKFWMVTAVLADGRLQLVTRTGKTHVISVEDPLLRRAGWWTRFRYRSRFPGLEVINSPDSSQRSDTTTPMMAGTGAGS